MSEAEKLKKCMDEVSYDEQAIIYLEDLISKIKEGKESEPAFMLLIPDVNDTEKRLSMGVEGIIHNISDGEMAVCMDAVISENEQIIPIMLQLKMWRALDAK